ncbi:MAG: hypothetical protein R3D63_14145 [Paracoccaceae bacterium]
MKGVVPRFDVPDVDIALGGAGDLQVQRIKCGHDRGRPVIVAMADGQPERIGFHQDAGVDGILHLFHRQGRDPKAAQRLGHHQPFGLQPVECLAQRREAHVVTLAQVGHAQRLTGGQRALDDVATDGKIGFLGQGHRGGSS